MKEKNVEYNVAEFYIDASNNNLQEALANMKL